MENTPAAEIFETTRLLKAWSAGDETALERMVPLDEARRRQALKYGDDSVQVSLANAEGIAHEKGADLVALDDALKELATFDERQSKIVEMRFFGG